MDAAASESYAPISAYALLGDCHGTALVRDDASIDWACLRRFDSGAVFCRLLDARRGGAFTLTVDDLQERSRRYLPDTNVLETTLRTPGGEVRVLDAFAMRRGGRRLPLRQLLRVIEGVRGHVRVDVAIEPRFDYASLHPWLDHHTRSNVFSAVGGNDAIVVQADAPIDVDREAVALRARVEVRAGQRTRFSLRATEPYAMDLRRVAAAEIDRRLEATIGWWRAWVASGRRRRAPTRYADAVTRSALVLKLLTCAPTGAIIAAPTTSLPEEPGGRRNWDYRFSWVRDATMTLAALVAAGHPDVADGFRRFIETATAGSADELQILYGCYGERRLVESELPHLDGYRGSRPVRAGNAAVAQLQLDVFGELMDAAHLWRKAGAPLSERSWRFLRGVVDAACRRWTEPDQGLWEFRSDPRHFVYSKVMCWVAVDRGLTAAREQQLCCDIDRWTHARDAIRASIEEHGVDARRGCFVQHYGSEEVDASLLRLPIVGFVRADDPRMVATVEAIQRDLARGPLLRRYRSERTGDGLKGGEGAFLMASFWLVDVLAMQGRVDEATGLFEQVLALGNDLGLFSEECHRETHELLGNFPQAFTHLALINAASQLERARTGGGSERFLGDRPLPPAGRGRGGKRG